MILVIVRAIDDFKLVAWELISLFVCQTFLNDEKRDRK